MADLKKETLCSGCHWYKMDDPYKTLSNGKFYPCTNICVPGWEYWDEHQQAPEECVYYCKRGEYVPTGVWAGVAEVVKAVAEKIGENEDESTRFYLSSLGNETTLE